MKSVLFFITLAATSAFGAVTYQMIGGVPANNLCDAGSVFHTLQPVSVCDMWSHKPEVNRGEYVEPGEWKCVASHMTHLTISKKTRVCTKYVSTEMETGCVSWEDGTQGNKVVAERVTEYGEASRVEYFDYVIPACN